jgi:hypothetical protein
MIWLTWRQFRTQATVVYAALAVLVLVLAATAPGLADLQDAAGTDFLNRLTPTDQSVYYAGLAVVVFVPAVVGMFWGAPLITRELEAGTHRLAWNQTVTRNRWLAVKLGLTGLATTAAAALAGLAVTWWCGPIDRAVNGDGSSDVAAYLPRLHPLIFDGRGIAPAGHAAFAFILGVTIGVLVRRTLPAMAITLAVFIAVQIAMPLWVRPHRATPAHVTVPITATTRLSLGNNDSLSVNIGKPGAWLISEQTLNASGRPAALPASVTDCVNSRTSPDICIGKLADLHYQQLATYQPAHNFWPLQWAEAALFLGLSLALTGFCVWRIRRLS